MQYRTTFLSDNVEKDPEDSEYSSDNDLAFWQEMKRHAKRKTKTSPPKKFLYKYLPHKGKFENEKIKSNSTKCHITVPSYNDQQSALTKEASNKSDEVKIFRKYPPHKSKLENDKIRYSSRNYDVTVQSFNDQQSALIKEGNKKSDEVSNVVNGPESGDDWITDDEVDDEDQESIELAFKREWKAKRLPNHSKEKNFVCEICGKRYAKHTVLRTHVVREHKEHEEAKKYPYSCAHCKRVYIRENQLLLHQQQYSGPCEICGVMLGCSGLFWTHRRNHIPCINIRNQNQNNNVCKICNRVFHTKGSVYMHMRVKHSNKLVSCPECNRKFPFEFLKKRHIAQAHHNAELIRYTCDICDFWGLTKRALKIHQKVIHSDSPKLRMYTCDECKAKFNSRIDYNIHVAIHTDKSSIGCPRSSKKFTSQSKLQAKRISTDEISSGKNTVSSQLDNSHVSQYLCALCNITVGNSEDLVQHMHKYHDMDVDSPREIKLELGSVHPLGINENTKSMVQAVGDKEVISQELDRPQNEPANVSFSTDPRCSNARSAMLMPTSVVPPNVNMMEIHGVQYHFIRETKYQ